MDLIERLQKYKCDQLSSCWFHHPTIADEAAAEIARLTALLKASESLKAGYIDAVANLTAERDRMREALQEIAHRHIGDQPSAYNNDDAWARRCYNELRLIARTALAAEPEQN